MMSYLEILFTVESIVNNVDLPCDDLTAHGTDMSNFLDKQNIIQLGSRVSISSSP